MNRLLDVFTVMDSMTGKDQQALEFDASVDAINFRCFFRGNGGTVNVLRISGPQGYPECGTQRVSQ